MEDLNVQPFEGFEQKKFEKVWVAHSTQIQNLEDKVRTLKKNSVKVELQPVDLAAADLQDTIILSGNAVPLLSDNSRRQRSLRLSWIIASLTMLL